MRGVWQIGELARIGVPGRTSRRSGFEPALRRDSWESTKNL